MKVKFNKEFVRLNIAIIPPEEIAEDAIELSQMLSKLGEVKFVLDGKNFHPHVTCYSPEFPTKNYKKILDSITRIAREVSAFNNKIDGLVATQEDPGGIEIRFEKSAKIDQLHRRIIKELNPLREGHLQEKYKKPDYVLRFPSDKRKLMEKIMHKVGYPRVLDVYNPHISITRFKNAEIVKKALKLAKWKRKTVEINKLGIFTMGEYGTCRKLLYKFDFKKHPANRRGV